MGGRDRGGAVAPRTWGDRTPPVAPCLPQKVSLPVARVTSEVPDVSFELHTASSRVRLVHQLYKGNTTSTRFKTTRLLLTATLHVPMRLCPVCFAVTRPLRVRELINAYANTRGLGGAGFNK